MNTNGDDFRMRSLSPAQRALLGEVLRRGLTLPGQSSSPGGAAGFARRYGERPDLFVAECFGGATAAKTGLPPLSERDSGGVAK